MAINRYRERLARCSGLMKEAGFARTLERERNEDRTDAGMMADGG